MKATEIATRAAELVGSDRNEAHGDMVQHFSAVAGFWNALLTAAGKAPAAPIDAHDVGNMMETLKIARRYTGTVNVDDYIDGAGYAACAGEVVARLAAKC